MLVAKGEDEAAGRVIIVVWREVVTRSVQRVIRSFVSVIPYEIHYSPHICQVIEVQVDFIIQYTLTLTLRG